MGVTPPERPRGFLKGVTSGAVTTAASSIKKPLPGTPPIPGAGVTTSSPSPLSVLKAAKTEAAPDPDRAGKRVSEKAGEAVGGIAAETVKGAVHGAAAGGVGAVPGAVKGLAVGTGKAVLRSSTGRKMILVGLAMSVLPVLIVTIMVINLVSVLATKAAGGSGDQAARASAQSAVAEGLTQQTVSIISASGQVAGVQWQTVAAIYQAQKGDPANPYRLTPASGATPVVMSDLASSSAFVANLLADRLRAQDGWRQNLDIANGAVVTQAGAIRWLISDTQQQEQANGYISSLAQLPVDNASTSWAGQVYQTALRWRLGISGMNGCINTNLPAASTPTASATSTSTQLTVTSSSGESVQVTPAMLQNVAIMVDVAKKADLSHQAMLIAAMTMAVESKWLNLASRAVPESLSYPNDGVVDGDHDSINPFQQRAYTGAWGTPQQLMDPAYAASMFFGLNPAGAPVGHARGLIQISGWETMPLGEAAQKVQVSAFPDRYAQWEQAASDIIAAAAGIQINGSCGVTAGSTDASDTYGPYWASYGRVEGIDPWSFYWGECVSYAAWMVRTTSKYPDFTNNWHGQHFGNAYQWFAAARAAGIVVDQTPAVGAIAVHMQGPGKSYPVGHVAYVSQVYPDGNIDVTEYNFAGHHIFGTRTNLPALSQFDYFIHFER